jgi:hypothetical protein
MADDPTPWIEQLHASSQRMAEEVAGLRPDGPTACTEWTVGQLLSHLGSQAEILTLFLDAGLSGTEAPGPDAFAPIWDAWNAKPSDVQVADGLAADRALLEGEIGAPAQIVEGMACHAALLFESSSARIYQPADFRLALDQAGDSTGRSIA